MASGAVKPMTVVQWPEVDQSGGAVKMSGGSGSVMTAEGFRRCSGPGKGSTGWSLARWSFQDKEGDRRTTVDGDAC